MPGALGTTFKNDLMKLIFQAVAIANIADNAASFPLTNLYISLHTSDPGAGGNQTTNEISYTGYARVAIARTSGGWAITGEIANPVAQIVFGIMTAGAGGTVTHAAVGTAASGTGKILYGAGCAVVPNQLVSNGVTPKLAVTSAFTIN